MEGVYDLIFPVPRKNQTPSQQWWSKQGSKKPFYLSETWSITGEAWIYDEQGIQTDNAELRFGNHPYMRGFTICLAVHWKTDDKYEFQNIQAAAAGSTLTGFVGGCTVVFKPNPFQIAKLTRFMERHSQILNIAAFVGNEMFRCEKLLKE